MALQVGHTYRYKCLWIVPQHHKIAICFCAEKNWCFWFNSDPRFHGHGQIAVTSAEHAAALVKDCTLSLADVFAISSQELVTAEDKGATPNALLVRLVSVLKTQLKHCQMFIEI